MLGVGDRRLKDAVLGPPGPAQRRAVAKTITLLESSRADHRARADELLNALLPATGKAFRLGISGVPTFIFDRKFGVSGAQPPEALAGAMREAAAA